MKPKAFVHFHLHLAMELPLLLICYLVALWKYRRKSLWLITERGTDARDNGMHLFRYIRTRHPEIQAYYAITKNSPDLKNVAPYDHVVYFGSWKHKMIYCAAKMLINTQATSRPSPFPYADTAWRHRGLFKNKKYIGIKHGIDEGYYSIWDKQTARLDLMICGARPEYESILKNYHYETGEVRYTGLARFDALLKAPIPARRTILLMPTWRKYLKNLSSEDFKDSAYFKRWNSLLESEAFLRLAEEYQCRIVFYPHTELQKFLPSFSVRNPKILLADEEHYDVQQLLMTSSVLITDYSSIFFDFAYMGRPVCYYQFDQREFRRYHYAQGYFNYDTMGFGPVCQREEDVLSFLRETAQNAFSVFPIYDARAKDFFPLRDENNCKRIYEAILSIPNGGSGYDK